MANPTGIDLCSGTTNGDTLPEINTYETRTITFSSTASLVSGTEYAIVIRALEADIANPAYIGGKYPGTYANGTIKLSSDSGSSWSDWSGRDFFFQTFEGVTYKDQYGPSSPYNSNSSCYGTYWRAQTFIASSSYDISKVKLKLARYTGASPGTITVSIQATGYKVISDVFLGGEGSFVAAATDKGVSLSTDFGDSWSQKLPDDNSSTEWERICCSDDGTYIITWDTSGNVYRSANSGTSWASIDPPDGDTFSPNDIAISDSGQYVLIVGSNSTNTSESAYLSSDYGATWSPVNPISGGTPAWDECAIDDTGNVMSLSDTSLGYFYASFDGGTTWTSQNIPASSSNRSSIGISGDGTLGMVANTGDNNEVFMNTGYHSKVSLSDTAITSAGRALLDDSTASAQVTTLGFTESAEDISNHVFGDGTDHTYIDQDLQTSASPTFAGMTIVNAINEFSTDNTLGGNSDTALPTEKAVKTYIDGALAFLDDNVSGQILVGLDSGNYQWEFPIRMECGVANTSYDGDALTGGNASASHSETLDGGNASF